MNDRQLTDLQKKLGYKFKNAALLKAALTHSSYANENKKNGQQSNERLEFLGDSVLGMTVAALLYNGKPQLPEGRMTRLRAELVCEKSLASLVAILDLGECLMLGRGEEKGGGRSRPSILADAVEAVLAAMYLDGGFKPVEKFVLKHLGPVAELQERAVTDHKTALQEIVQEKTGQSLVYHLTDESGPDHLKVFSVEVLLNGAAIGSGTGRTKKEAEQSAAKAAIAVLAK